jgi:penicillin-binding protein 1A
VEQTDPNAEAGSAASDAASARRRRTTRTAAAAREFAKALAHDLAAIAHRLTRSARRFANSLAAHRPAKRRRLVLPAVATAILVLLIAAAAALPVAMMWAVRGLPLDRNVREADRPALLLEAANGESLGRVGPLKVAESPRSEFPQHLVQAVLSIEDRRFYSHFGIDPFGMIRAMRRNLAESAVVEGGSTITQQLVKIRFLGNERTYQRKLREALVAMWTEWKLSKDEILSAYLESVYLGAGAYGMTAAARVYFDKRPSELTIPEAAMLAGLIKAPSLYNPLSNMEKARARAAHVIDVMLDAGAIDQQTARDAKAQPAKLKLTADVAHAGSWFADWIAREATALTDSFPRSVRLRTTLMPDLQRLAEQVIGEALAKQGRRAGVSQAALVALRADGAVLAMVGGRDYDRSQFNRAIEANRQPGSAFKLFVYLAALRKGFSPHDTIDAGPLEIRGWRPENFGGSQYGTVTLAEGFSKSINTAAVRLAMDVGLNEVIATARDLGIDAQLAPFPSLALGAVEVSLLDLTGAFASVRAGRTRVEPWGIHALGVEGQPHLRPVGPPWGSGRQIGPAREKMIDLLRLVVDSGTGRGARLDSFAAGKTGTSQNHRDAWFIGFNEMLTVGVWVGNDDGTPMPGMVGGSLPATIWKTFMSRARDLVPAQEAVAAAPDAGAVTPQQPGEAGPGQCDYRACTAAYRSFRASDCTYQSYGGPRRVCERGDRPIESAERTAQATDARGEARCNVDVCSRFYQSFDPSDCTYKPYGGGSRQLCER